MARDVKMANAVPTFRITPKSPLNHLMVGHHHHSCSNQEFKISKFFQSLLWVSQFTPTLYLLIEKMIILIAVGQILSDCQSSCIQMGSLTVGYIAGWGKALAWNMEAQLDLEGHKAWWVRQIRLSTQLDSLNWAGNVILSQVDSGESKQVFKLWEEKKCMKGKRWGLNLIHLLQWLAKGPANCGNVVGIR